MKVSELVNRVEPFKFEFDGLVLEGTYYKYRTTVPSYGRELEKSIPELLEEGTDEEKQARIKQREDALEAAGFRAIADTIKTWNAEDDDGNPLMVTAEVFNSLPDPFTTKFLAFLRELREGNPTNGNGSQHGSQPS